MARALAADDAATWGSEDLATTTGESLLLWWWVERILTVRVDICGVREEGVRSHGEPGGGRKGETYADGC